MAQGNWKPLQETIVTHGTASVKWQYLKEVCRWNDLREELQNGVREKLEFLLSEMDLWILWNLQVGVIMIPNNLNGSNTKIKGKLVPTTTDVDSQKVLEIVCATVNQVGQI